MQTFDFSDIKVLVVDTNDFMTRTVGAILKGLGFERITSFTRADQALHWLNSVSVDLVITSWDLQPFNGRELIQAVRDSENDESRFVPILVLTAHSEKHRVELARDAGANEFVVKPIVPLTLLEHLLAIANKPRPFVESKTFFGPDRRRQTKPFENSERRTKTRKDATGPSSKNNKADSSTSRQTGSTARKWDDMR